MILLVFHPGDSFNGVSCIEWSEPLTEAHRLLATGPQPADLLPPDCLAQLRDLRWVMGDEVVELAGIGWYHAGSSVARYQQLSRWVQGIGLAERILEGPPSGGPSTCPTNTGHTHTPAVPTCTWAEPPHAPTLERALPDLPVYV